MKTNIKSKRKLLASLAIAAAMSGALAVAPVASADEFGGTVAGFEAANRIGQTGDAGLILAEFARASSAGSECVTNGEYNERCQIEFALYLGLAQYAEALGATQG